MKRPACGEIYRVLTEKITVGFSGDEKDYFLGASGQVGSAVSERGFHHWLADFIGWKLPSVITFEGKDTTLYLECIFPLFFVEKKARDGRRYKQTCLHITELRMLSEPLMNSV